MNTTTVRSLIVAGIITLFTGPGVAGDINLPPLDTPYDQCTWLATHNSFANPDEGFLSARSNQPDSITDQLNYGVRFINLDIWLIRQRPDFFGCYIWEEYTGTNTTPGNRFSTDDPLQIVVAHGLDQPTADLFHDPCDPWKSLRAVLDEIGTWAQQHPNEVVTIQFETKIHGAHEGLINGVINSSGIANRRFFPNAPEPSTNSLPAPEGRPGGWRVDRYGWPTLQQIVQSGKNVVLFPSYVPRSLDDSWKLEVQTVYGHSCLPPFDLGRDWILPRDESASPNDFTRPLFSVVHVPDLPGINDYTGPSGVNNLILLLKKWQDIHDVYHRIPNVIWMDYYERGFHGPIPGNPPAPAFFLNVLNETWNDQPVVTGHSQATPPPNAHGWNNTDVRVNLSGSGDTIRTIVSRSFGATGTANSVNSTYNLTNEGVTTVSFNAIGSLGKRSPTLLLDVSIDKTPPTITGSLDRPPDANGWYASNVTAHFECADTRSGIDVCPADILLDQEGANQSVTGTTFDRANNQASITITNINIDKTAPVIQASANPGSIWPPNNKLVPIIVSGTITDAGSGVDPATTTFVVVDEYNKIQPTGKILVTSKGNFSFTMRLEASRLGQDLNGRCYLIKIKASDKAGHSAESQFKLIVPHDQSAKPKAAAVPPPKVAEKKTAAVPPAKVAQKKLR